MSRFVWDNANDTMNRLGDLNNDGLEDLLVYFPLTDYSLLTQNQSIWYYPRDVATGFSNPVVVELSESTHSGSLHDISIFDFNSDGLTDIVFLIDEGQRIVPWLRTESGWTEGAPLETPIEFCPDDICHFRIADIDQDGLPDILFWNGALQVAAWYNNGDGEYTRVVLNADEVGQSLPVIEQEAVISDYEGDGDLDVIIKERDVVFLIEQTDSGSFRDMQFAYIQASNILHQNEPSAFADVNGDGLQDFVTFAFENEFYNTDGIAILLAPFSLEDEEQVHFIPTPSFNSDSHLNQLLAPGRIVSPGDLDGDGTEDIVRINGVLESTGLTLFDPLNQHGRRGFSMHYAAHGDGSFSQLANSFSPEPGLNRQYQYTDINSDGVSDRLIVTSVRVSHDLGEQEVDHSGIMVWGLLSNPYEPGTVLSEQDTIVAVSDMTHLTHVDIDLDGRQELILTRDSAVRVIDEVDGFGYRYSPDTRFDDICGFRSLVAQFDTNPTPDLISMRLNTGGGRPAPAVYMNIKAGEFGTLTVNNAINYQYYNDRILDPVQDAALEGGSSAFSAGDVNGDGFDDLILRGYYVAGDISYDSACIVWFSDGAGGFSLGPATELSFPPGPNGELIEAINLNDDAYCDIITFGNRESGFTLEAFTSSGDGNFEPSWSAPLNGAHGFELPYWLHVDDFNSDGWDDVVALRTDRHSFSHAYIYFGSNEGLASDPIILMGRGDLEVTSVDLDGNGLKDIISCHNREYQQLPSSVSIYYQITNREFLPRISINDLTMSGVDSLDLNNDGAPDLIACQSLSSSFIGPDNVRVFYSIPSPCLPDLNLDKQLNFYDISLFIELFLAQRPLVDFNRDGSHNFFDVSAMIESYLQGCP